MSEQLMTWHDDGHYIVLRISKADLEIVDVHCPDVEGAKCKDDVYGCLVKHFVHRYGLDCNAGTCPAIEKMDICWTLIGDRRIVEECQLWFMPKADEVFSAWLQTVKN
jgi:hypothetical protein